MQNTAVAERRFLNSLPASVLSKTFTLMLFVISVSAQDLMAKSFCHIAQKPVPNSIRFWRVQNVCKSQKLLQSVIHIVWYYRACYR